MHPPEKTIDHGTLRRLVEASAPLGAESIGGAGGWAVVIRCGRARQSLASPRGKPHAFRQFDTRARRSTWISSSRRRQRTPASGQHRRSADACKAGARSSCGRTTAWSTA
jgi:hypothetical protein